MRCEAAVIPTDDAPEKSADTVPGIIPDIVPLQGGGDSDGRRMDTGDSATGIAGPRAPSPVQRNESAVLQGCSDLTAPEAPCSP